MTENLRAARPVQNSGEYGADRGTALFGTLAGVAALFSAAACCVLPLAFAALGLGAGGLAAMVPFHWPFTIAALSALALGWFFYIRKRRACRREADCSIAQPSRSTLITLCAATLLVSVSAAWAFIETPLMRLLGGA